MNTLIISIKTAASQWKAILLIYGITTLLSAIIGLGTINIITDGLGNSAEMDELIAGFNRTVYGDFRNHYGEGLKNVKQMAKWLLLIYLLISIGLHAGLLYNIKTKQTSIKSFLVGLKKYYIPFVGFTLFYIIVAAVIGGLIFVPYFTILGNPFTDYTTELPFLYSLASVSFLFILALILVTTWSINTRLTYIESNAFLKSIKIGFKAVFKHLFKNVGWGLLMLIISAILFYFFVLLNQSNSASSWSWTIVVMIGMQLITLAKTFIRAAYYKGLETID